MTKDLAQLPEEYATQLNTLRENEQFTELHNLTASLRAKGWPLRAIATPLGVSRTAVRNWELAGSANTETIAPPPTTHGTRTKVKRIVPDVPPAERSHLRELQVLASKRTRWSNANSPEARAAAELTALVRQYQNRRVPLATIAKHAGVTRRAIAQRLEGAN